MREYSKPARRYIVGIILAGAIVLTWELSHLTSPVIWLCLGMGILGLLTYRFKRQDPSPTAVRRTSLLVIVAGMVPVLGQLPQLEQQQTWTLVGLGMLAAATHLLKQPGPTERSSYQISFVVYGFTLILLGSPATIFVVLVAHLVEYVCGTYYPWYIQSFNVSTFILATSAAGFVVRLSNHDHLFHTPISLLGIITPLTLFVLINSLLVGNVLRLARGQSFRESGVFDKQSLLIDLCHLCMGASAALLWHYNPFAVLITVMPLYLVYNSLRVPALERRSEIDPKTGLYNARYFQQELESELERANRFNRPLSLVMADLDLLRNINNTYGHLAGDIVLQGIATQLKQLSRNYDIVARFGGEEFAILFPETSTETALQIAEEMRHAIAQTPFVIDHSQSTIQATMSFGVAGRDCPETSGDDLVHNADLALYQAKDSGRNRVIRFSKA